MNAAGTAEGKRLEDDRLGKVNWRRWGTYVSDRQWGTVREDYSADGSAWDFFPHDHARSRAYRWGEDAIAGWCDDRQLLCLGLAVWNGRDPIIKERLFGLNNREGNHGEDVKELYYHLDALPTSAYSRFLYKYPQREYPYSDLLRVNGDRTKLEPEYELSDTGIFEDDRYFDLQVEFAKGGPDEVLMRIEAFNRGPEDADLWIIPQAWFRNTWAFAPGATRPTIARRDAGLAISHPELPPMWLVAEDEHEALFCENETNAVRHFGHSRAGRTFKDGIHERLIHGAADACNAAAKGSKCALVHRRRISAGSSAVVIVRLVADRRGTPAIDGPAAAGAAALLHVRRGEADEFWEAHQVNVADPDERRVQRQAWAGLLWSRQWYCFDVRRWLHGDEGLPPPPPQRLHGRNSGWGHLKNSGIISMPDTWEYPWYAAWDLAFHCVCFADFDPEFAKAQLLILVGEDSMHPDGALPAYEWAFDDANPPVHAWAAQHIYAIDAAQRGEGDHDFLCRVFNRLLLNFTWWVNRKDADGRNVFEGGFLGLDNIGIFDRSAALPTGGRLQQADATSWMAMYALNMMRLACILAEHDHVYEDMAIKFFRHFLDIAQAIADFGATGEGLWDERDEFYYDRLRLPDGTATPLRIQSIVGLIPIFAVEVVQPEQLGRMSRFKAALEEVLRDRPDLAALVSHWNEAGRGEVRLFSLLRGHRLVALLRRALDEAEFLAPYGIRSMSKRLDAEPYIFWAGGRSFSVRYESAESQTGSFGGNSNWRGPIWMPINYLLIESLFRFHRYYGDEFRVECPAGSGQQLTLRQVAIHLAGRLRGLFARDAAGLRPFLGPPSKQQSGAAFRDLPLFHEYFDGDNGHGCGAAHQTGWTALIARLIARTALEDSISMGA